MAWTPPSVADLKARFPIFANVDETTLQLILNEAIAEVGVEWIEQDRAPAALYLSAHLLAGEGLAGATGTGGGGAAITGAVKKRKVGDVEVEFAGVASTGGGSGGWGASPYDSTIYGQRYLLLLRRNFPAVAVV